jgi:hypothetical protein
VAVQDLTDNLRPDDGAALACPAGGALDQLTLKSQSPEGVAHLVERGSPKCEKIGVTPKVN